MGSVKGKQTKTTRLAHEVSQPVCYGTSHRGGCTRALRCCILA